jgi:hypothetical protein
MWPQTEAVITHSLTAVEDVKLQANYNYTLLIMDSIAKMRYFR